MKKTNIRRRNTRIIIRKKFGETITITTIITTELWSSIVMIFMKLKSIFFTNNFLVTLVDKFYLKDNQK